MVPLRNFSQRLFSEPGQRLAWLRPEHAAHYPEIPVGVWMTAQSAASVVIRGVLGKARSWPGPGQRVLVEEHFIFRGGGARTPGWRGPGSRADDP